LSSDTQAPEPSIRNYMSNQTFDALKLIAMVILPTLGTLYFALAVIWGFGFGEQVVGTITAIDAALGVILGLSTRAYNKTSSAPYEVGEMVRTTDENGAFGIRLVLNSDPVEFASKKVISFKTVDKVESQ